MPTKMSHAMTMNVTGGYRLFFLPYPFFCFFWCSGEITCSKIKIKGEGRQESPGSAHRRIIGDGVFPTEYCWFSKSILCLWPHIIIGPRPQGNVHLLRTHNANFRSS